MKFEIVKHGTRGIVIAAVLFFIFGSNEGKQNKACYTAVKDKDTAFKK